MVTPSAIVSLDRLVISLTSQVEPASNDFVLPHPIKTIISIVVAHMAAKVVMNLFLVIIFSSFKTFKRVTGVILKTGEMSLKLILLARC